MYMYLLWPIGDIEDEEESAMASAEDQKESEFQVLVIETLTQIIAFICNAVTPKRMHK